MSKDIKIFSVFRSQNAFANAFANRAVRERERRANARSQNLHFATAARNPDYASFREQIRERRANAPCTYLPPVGITNR